MALRRIRKEYNDILQEPLDSAEVILPVEDDFFTWQIKMIAPPPYDGMEIFLTFNFPRDYPFKPPKIMFEKPFPYHPFISESKEGGWCNHCVWDCFLKLEWSPALTVQKLMPLIRNFLEFPPLDDSLDTSTPLGRELRGKGHDGFHTAVRAYYREKQNTSNQQNDNSATN